MNHTGLTNASTFNPPGNLNPNLAVFKDLMIRDLEEYNIKNRLDTYVQNSVRTLCERKGLIICPANKGGGIVLLDIQDYQCELKNLLVDWLTYKILNRDPTSTKKP